MDAERFDHQAIRVFDIPKTQLKAIIFEDMQLTNNDRKDCLELLKKTITP